MNSISYPIDYSDNVIISFSIVFADSYISTKPILSNFSSAYTFESKLTRSDSAVYFFDSIRYSIYIDYAVSGKFYGTV